ncbi:MAG: hypothetical protein RI973_2347 [Bacteroidota bacterium]|jgi:Spy/CpxP family protein refolding chaperone
MKKSKRLFLLIALCLASTTASLQAQQGANGRGSDPAQRAEMQTTRMKEELGLSDKQAEKVKAINTKYANKMKELRETNRDGDRTAMREAMTSLRQEQSEELKSVLTAEQFEKWQQLQSEGPGGRNGNGPPNGNN